MNRLRISLRALAVPAKYIFGLGLIVVLIAQFPMSEIVPVLGRVGLAWVALATGLFLASKLADTIRLYILARADGVRFGELFAAVFVSMFFSQVLPSNIGGDGYRIWFINRSVKNWGRSGAFVLIDRVLSLFVIALAATVWWLTNPTRISILLESRGLNIALDSGQLVFIWISLAFALALGLIIMLRFKNLWAKLVQACRDGWSTLRMLKVGQWLGVTLFAVMQHALRIAGFLILIQSLGLKITWTDLIFLQALTMVVTLVPLSLGGLGILEGIILFGLVLFGVPQADGLVIALVNRVIMLVFALLGGIFLPILKRSGIVKDVS